MYDPHQLQRKDVYLCVGTLTSMIDREAIAYLRDRRSLFFFGDIGPPLPEGVEARWRLTPTEPRGWHANMVGFVEAPAHQLEPTLRTAITWFGSYEADTWLDADEFTTPFAQPALVDQLGFELVDDWDAMLCRQAPTVPHNPAIRLQVVEREPDLLAAAWIGEHADRGDMVARTDRLVRKRAARYLDEHRRYGTTFLLASVDGEPVGAARLTDEELPVIVGVVTLPAWRGHGVATAVTTTLARMAIDRHGVVALYTERGSQAAGIYDRLGFSPIFRTRAWVRRLGCHGALYGQGRAVDRSTGDV